MERRTSNRIRKVYGGEGDHYDLFLGGLFKSKHKKKKEKLDIKQRDANLSLTQKQNQIADAKAQAEVYRAQAEQMKALAAQKLAQKAESQLQGAKATTQLKYVGMAIAAIVLVGGVTLTIYMIKQGKKAALISKKLAMVKAAKK
jgi:multidrug efflux pump subunit AcrA (membrane-fusion protein)